MRLLVTTWVFATGCDVLTGQESISRPPINDAAVDAGTLRTAKFSAQLCTGGNPGDPTCPVNTVDLAPHLDAQLRLTAMPSGQNLVIANGMLMPRSAISAQGIALEVWGTGTTPESRHVLAGAVSGSAAVSLDTFTITMFGAADQLAVAIDP